MKILTCLFTLVIFNLNLVAQTSAREVIVKRSLHINDSDPMSLSTQCNYELLVPTNIMGKQQVIQSQYPGIKPHHFNRTPDNEYYLVWQNVSFLALQKNNLQADIKLKLFKYDLNTAKQHPIKDTAYADTARYLKSEENFNTKAKNIKAAAEQIADTTREEMVKAIFNYTTRSLDYHIYYYQDRGAKQALKDGRGDCTEYSELMVTLCRTKKIPARIVMGLTIHSNGKVGHHNWVEVYFPLYGWVAFDPTWADGPNANTTFYKMKNSYVQLSYNRYPHTLRNPCGEAGVVARIKLLDTCTDLTSNIYKKIDAMYNYYSHYQLQEANLVLDTLLMLEPNSSYFLNFKGMVSARQANYDLAYQYLQSAVKNAETAADKVGITYSLSNYYALKFQPDSAVAYLRDALKSGFKNYKQIIHDTDFYNIKAYPAFVQIIDSLKQLPSTNKK